MEIEQLPLVNKACMKTNAIKIEIRQSKEINLKKPMSTLGGHWLNSVFLWCLTPNIFIEA
jgi:hypothetical protein